MVIMVIKGIILSASNVCIFSFFLDLAQVQLMPLMPVLPTFLRAGWLSMTKDSETNIRIPRSDFLEFFDKLTRK
jgi:hypothetical protein